MRPNDKFSAEYVARTDQKGREHTWIPLHEERREIREGFNWF